MATIVVLAGEHDRFHTRQFMLQQLFPFWIEAGHVVVVHEGPGEPPPADIAILHVDLTVVPSEYTQWLSRYRIVLNGGTGAIGKRSYSQLLVAQGDGYEGPVIVKTDANCAGLPELHWSEMELRKGRAVEVGVRYIKGRYPVFASPAQVPPQVWDDAQLIVERFVPERTVSGYGLRVYLFLGDSDRCSRVFGPHPVVKGSDGVARVPVSLPEEVRAFRRRLGFDYGKIDFVVHEGHPVILDVNRTPTMPGGQISAAVLAGMKDLARGIDSFCQPG